MNKPIKQLELIPAAVVDASPPTNPELLAAFGRAGIPPAEAERLIAEAGPDPDDFDWNTPDDAALPFRGNAPLRPIFIGLLPATSRRI